MIQDCNGIRPLASNEKLHVGNRSFFNHELQVVGVKTSNYTLARGELAYFDISGGNLTATLPANMPNDSIVGIKISTGSNTNALTITASGAESLNVRGNTSVKLFLAGDYVEFIKFGGTWYCVSESIVPHACEMRGSNTTGQSISNATQTTVDMDVTIYDVGGVADLTNDRVLVRRDGIYSVTGSLGFDAPTMTANTGVLQVLFGGTAPNRAFQQQAIDQTSMYLAGVWLQKLNAGEFVNLRVFHNNGGSRSLSSAGPPRLAVAEVR